MSIINVGNLIAYISAPNYLDLRATKYEVPTLNMRFSVTYSNYFDPC